MAEEPLEDGARGGRGPRDDDDGDLARDAEEEEEEDDEAEADLESVPEDLGWLPSTGASEWVARLAVMFSLSVARTFLHVPTEPVLTTVAGVEVSEDRRFDLAGIADGIVRASTRAMRNSGLAGPGFGMTGEAFTIMLRLATQLSEPTRGLSSSDMYKAAKAYAYLQHYGAPVRPALLRPNPKAPVIEMRRYARVAMASYGTLAMKFLGVLSRIDTQVWSNTQAIEYLTGISTVDNLLTAQWRANWVGSIYHPGHFVLLDHEHKEVIVAVRGSYRFQDAVTDLMCEDTAFSFHYSKEDDLENAQRELQEVFSTLSEALAGFEDRSASQLGQEVAETTAELYRGLQDWVARQSRLVGEELQAARSAAGALVPRADVVPGADLEADEEPYLDDEEYGEDLVDEEDDEDGAGHGRHARKTLYMTREKTRAGTLDDSSKYPHAQAPQGHRHVKGRAHFGFLKAAQALALELEDLVVDAMRSHESYKLVLVGHSLGAAVATLITLLWCHHPDLRSARCYAFASPSSLSQDVAESPIAQARITSIVLANDVVPRLSLGAVSDLRNSILHCATETVKGDKKGRTITKYVLDAVSADLSDEKMRKLSAPILKTIRAQEHVHSTLLPAGIVYHIPSMDLGPGAFKVARKCPNTQFGEIVLAPGMFDAHLPQRYAEACCDKLPLSAADADAERLQEEVARKQQRSRNPARSLAQRLSRPRRSSRRSFRKKL